MVKPLVVFVLTSVCLVVVPVAAVADKPRKPQVSDAGTYDANGRYQLSEAELKLECKKLNGRINMRLLHLRAEYADTSQPTGASQALQVVTNPATKLFFGGASNYGTDRAGQLARDRAVVDAYNAQLVTKNCPSYDIAAELKKKPSDPPPSPSLKPAVASAKK
jgi:hypothetical protein